MRKVKRELLLSVFIIGFFLRAPFCKAEELRKARPPIEIKTTVDKKTLNIGDEIKYTVTISAAKDMEVEAPDFGKDFGNFSIKNFGTDKKTLFGQQKLTQWYVLNTYTTGTLHIPKTVIRYRMKGEKEWSQIEADEHAIEVKSLIDGRQGVLDDTDILDIENPVSLPSKKKNLLIYFLSLVIIGMSVFLVYVLRKKKALSSVPQPPAHEIAYAHLEALQRKGYLAQGKIKEYYSEVSDIIRRYLENRFNLKAPEMTTEEFLLLARESAQLQSQQKALLREFLTACDLVKFAKYAPASEEITAVFESAKRFIDQTAYVLP